MRRVIPHGDDGTRLLAAFRRTRRQSLGQGLFIGLIIGIVVSGAGLVAMIIGWMDRRHGPPDTWLWLIFGLAIPLAVGTVVGGITGVRTGVDADDLGIHSVPPMPRSFGPWTAIADIRIERRRSRTVVTLYLESGAVLRLRAPYDGRLLSRDPRFERKFFTLLNLWETHRNWRSRS